MNIRRTLAAFLVPTAIVGALAIGSNPALAIVPPDYSTRVTTGNAMVPGTTDIGNHCDDCTTAVTLPFPVTFYGTQYSTGHASSNGNFQFVGSNFGFDPTCLPKSTFSETIFAYWMDLQTDVTNTDGIFTATTGVTPNRQFVIEWRTHYFDVNADSANFEIIFSEASPTISVIYGASTTGGATTADTSGATAGVQRLTGSTQLTQYSCQTATTAVLTSGKRVDYTVPEPLTVTKNGTGTGTVTSTPAGIACGATCTAGFPSSGLVTLTPTPDTDMLFGGWGGACTGTGACQVTMNSPQSVSATFTRRPKFLTVSKAGSGTGHVTSAPVGIDCSATCAASFADGTPVTLTAVPDAGTTFTGWSGACTGTAACQVTMSADTAVSAQFTGPPMTLTVSKTGTGTVTSSPAGINCGTTCSASFPDGTAVTLTASPSAGMLFAGWTGACSGTGSCVVNMNAAEGVSAAFSVVPQLPRAGTSPRPPSPPFAVLLLALFGAVMVAFRLPAPAHR